MKHFAAALAGISCVMSSPVCGWERDEIRFSKIEEKAKALADKPYVAVDREALPAWMKSLSYDQYRDIRFRQDHSLWSQEKSKFRAQFFHPGYLFREPVMLHEYTDTHRQEIRFSQDFFEYGPLVPQRAEDKVDAGFAGLKIINDFHGKGVIDELVVFQGASYWRALGKNTRYGLSSRGLALDTGANGVPEEFPRFTEFWLGKPTEGADSIELFALMDSPSVAGAYRFRVIPGEDTVMEVRCVLFPRKVVQRFGMAPLSSMYWFGENSKRRFDDFRPEVHDSDGLVIHMASGEKVWRPIANDSGMLDFSFFSADHLKGFGLAQRDRRFSAYEDGEAAYHLRPSVWIEPTNDWGKGKVMLMEIPTVRELDDNIVATWVPDETPQPGRRYEFSYRQRWTLQGDLAAAGGHVVATRTGVHEWEPDQRTMVVEFAGGELDKVTDPATLQPMIEICGDGRESLKVKFSNVQQMEGGRWRVSFLLAPAQEGGKMADIAPVELRCCLKRGEDFLTETWVYRVKP
ncbi:MAG: glucans biosynthesis protein [Verrucomicrobia bacterium]|nr:MAG: glucans biosynthesis protein [Verrucomicrobiota bacterium]